MLLACSKLRTKLGTNRHRPLVKSCSPGSPNPLPGWEVMLDHRDKGQMANTVKQPLVEPRTLFPTNAVYVLTTLSQGREHNGWDYLSFYLANRPLPLPSAGWPHIPCLLNLPFFRSAGCVCRHRAGQDSRLLSREKMGMTSLPLGEYCHRVYLYLNPKYFLDSMIGTASWSTGVTGEEQAGTQIKKWLAWVPPENQKGPRKGLSGEVLVRSTCLHFSPWMGIHGSICTREHKLSQGYTISGQV